MKMQRVASPLLASRILDQLQSAAAPREHSVGALSLFCATNAFARSRTKRVGTAKAPDPAPLMLIAGAAAAAPPAGDGAGAPVPNADAEPG